MALTGSRVAQSSVCFKGLPLMPFKQAFATIFRSTSMLMPRLLVIVASHKCSHLCLDLWACVEAEVKINLPVALTSIMNSWTSQSGYPVVSVAATKAEDATSLRLTQGRFYLHKPSTTDQVWPMIWTDLLTTYRLGLCLSLYSTGAKMGYTATPSGSLMRRK